MPRKKAGVANVSLGDCFSKAFNCGLSFNRIMPFFLINVIILGSILLGLGSIISAITPGAATPTVQMIVAMLPGIIYMVIILIIMFFISLYFQAGLIENARDFYAGKKTRFSISLGKIRPKYLSVVGATLLVTLISFVVSFIPFLGSILALIVSWLFIVVTPSIIIGGKDAVASLGDSYNIFMKKKAQTFLFWLGLIILTIIFVLLSLIPLGISAIPILLTFKTVGIAAAVKSNIGVMVIGGIISAFFLGFVTVFQEAAKAFYYIKARKKR